MRWWPPVVFGLACWTWIYWQQFKRHVLGWPARNYLLSHVLASAPITLIVSLVGLLAVSDGVMFWRIHEWPHHWILCAVSPRSERWCGDTPGTTAPVCNAVTLRPTDLIAWVGPSGPKVECTIPANTTLVDYQQPDSSETRLLQKTLTQVLIPRTVPGCPTPSLGGLRGSVRKDSLAVYVEGASRPAVVPDYSPASPHFYNAITTRPAELKTYFDEHGMRLGTLQKGTRVHAYWAMETHGWTPVTTDGMTEGMVRTSDLAKPPG